MNTLYVSFGIQIAVGVVVVVWAVLCVRCWLRFEKRERAYHDRAKASIERRYRDRLWALHRHEEYHRALELRERRLRSVA